ncbi:MAG: glycosyltransferase family 4 protein [Patescibacteria group bacterium]|nr:glycosyltransferase family 4 protein [Patescibacteria group bacterium]
MPPNSPKKKLLHLITQPTWGGAQRYIFDLASSLKDEFDITVASGPLRQSESEASEIKDGRELLDRLEAQGIKTRVFPHLIRAINPIRDLQAFIQIFVYLYANKFDTIHLNSSKAGVLGSIAANIQSVPKIIYTAHGWVFNEPMPTWKKRFYKWAERLSAKHKTKIVTLSRLETEIGVLERIAPAEKFVQIYHGVKPIEFLSSDQARDELKIPRQIPVIGCIANFYETKGLEYIVKAWPQIIAAIPDAQLVIIGDGALRKKLESLIKKLNLDENIALAGSRPDASKYLKAFDVFALPSVKEGLPYVILEAMQAGVPIVATRVGGIPEMIEDGASGRLVPPADSAALATAIIKILQNKNLGESYAENARQTLTQKFSFERMIEQTRSLYN